MISTMQRGQSIPCCSAQTSPSSSTSAIWEAFPTLDADSSLFRPRCVDLAAGLYEPSGMSFRQAKVSGFPAVALRSAHLEVVAVPAIGMKLTNLRRLNGREGLGRSEQIPLAPPEPGTSYVETAD